MVKMPEELIVRLKTKLHHQRCNLKWFHKEYVAYMGLSYEDMLSELEKSSGINELLEYEVLGYLEEER